MDLKNNDDKIMNEMFNKDLTAQQKPAIKKLIFKLWEHIEKSDGKAVDKVLKKITEQAAEGLGVALILPHLVPTLEVVKLISKTDPLNVFASFTSGSVDLDADFSTYGDDDDDDASTSSASTGVGSSSSGKNTLSYLLEEPILRSTARELIINAKDIIRSSPPVSSIHTPIRFNRQANKVAIVLENREQRILGARMVIQQRIATCGIEAIGEL